MWILLLECFLISSAFSYCLNGDTEFANERQLNIRDALARQKGNIEEIEENSTADDLVTEKRQNSSAVEDYWAERARIVSREENTMLGGHLVLEKNEIFVNKSLMAAKKREFDEGFADPMKFLPAHSFLKTADLIRQSPVFKIIQKMPKGAVLHAHDLAIVSSKFIFWNITNRKNLYICEIDDVLKVHFFDAPNKKCDWKLLSDVRKSDMNNSIDQRILKQMTMVTENPDEEYPDVNRAWAKFMSIFGFITPMLTYRPVYEDHFYQGLLEFYNDNIQFLELRTTLPTLYELDGTTYGPVEVAHIYKNVTDRFIRDHPDFIGVKLIYAPVRQCTKEQLEEFMRTARSLKQELPNFIAGFDLVGQEDKGVPLVDFANELRLLDKDVQLFFHAGETNWYGTSTDENLIDAVMLNTTRIGHGYALLKHPEILKLVRKRKIAIEIAPISNQVLALVKDLRNHPASVLFADDYPVVVSNDDPGFWGAKGLSYDFYEAFMGMMSRNADLRALKKLAENSIEYSSLSQDEKNKAYDLWRRKWTEFVNDYQNNSQY